MDDIFSSIVEGTLTYKVALLVILCSILLGFLVSYTYMLVNKKEGYSTGFVITLIMLPVTISVIILLVENSIARAFSLAGAFALIRFRSAPGNPKDIAFVFFTLAIGLACGIGYLGYAVLFSIIMLLMITIIYFTNYGKPKYEDMLLKVSVPENINYIKLFDDILDKYTNGWEIKKVKTSDFGSIFIIEFIIKAKKDINQKEFIDELRCRNGNLNIVLTLNINSHDIAN